jgi:hypothetical protein
MTLGEFVYARGGTSSIELQARHARLPGFASWASFNVAAAVRALGHTYEVRLPAAGAARAALEVLVDGRPLGLPAGVYTIDGAVVKVDPEDAVEISVKEPDLPEELAGTDGAWTRVRIAKRPDNELVRENTREPAVSLYVSMGTPSVDRYRGLLGRPNGKVADELTGPDGEIVPALSQFIESWRVKDRAASLFTYAAGQGPETFNLVQDQRPPTRAELEGANGGRNFIAEVTSLIAEACGEDPNQVDPVFVIQNAMDMAAGRTASNMLENGLCFDGHVFAAGRSFAPTGGLAFSGRVTLTQPQGVGAAGASVLITSPTLGLKLCEAKSDDDGRFACGYVFELPAEMTTDLIMRVTGFGDEREMTRQVPTPAAGATTEVTQDFTIAAARVLRVRGQVLAPGGGPQALSYLRIPAPYRETQADGEGRYTFHVPLAASGSTGVLRIEATDPDARTFGAEDILFEATSEVTEIVRDIKLVANTPPPPAPVVVDESRRLTFTGKVTREVNPTAGVAGAEVILTAPGAFAGDACRTTATFDGRWVCTVEPSTSEGFTVTVEASLAGSARRRLLVDVTAAELPGPGQARVKTVGDVAVRPTRLEVSGVVTADGAAPVAGVALYAQVAGAAASGTADAQGRFKLVFDVSDGLLATSILETRATWVGQQNLFSRASVLQPVGLLSPGEINVRTIDVAFTERKLKLSGRVVNRLASGQPVTGARVRVFLTASPATPICTTFSDAQGIYACDHSVFDKQPFDVRYQVNDRGALDTEPVTIDPRTATLFGVTPFVQELAISPTTLRVSGTVERDNGSPVAGAGVELIGDINANLVASPSGVFDAYFDFANDVTARAFQIRATDGTGVVSVPLNVALTPMALTSVVERLVVPGTDNGAGTLLWTYDTGAHGVDEERPAVAPDGTVYVMVGLSGGGTRLVAIKPDGSLRWNYDFPNREYVARRVAVGADGTAFLRSARGGPNVHAIRPDGQRRFTFQSGDPVRSYPVVLADGGAAAIFGRKLHRITPTGASAWSADVNASAFDTAAVSRVEDTGAFVVVTTRGYDFNSTGSWASVSPTGQVTGPVPLPLGFEEILSVDPDGSLLAFRDNQYEGAAGGIARFSPDGTVLWSADGPNKRPVLSPGGTMYISGLSNLSTRERGYLSGLVAVAKNGTLLFRVQQNNAQWPGLTSTGLPLLTTNDSAAGGVANNQLRAFDVMGNPLWSFETGGQAYESAPLSGPDGSTILLVDRKVLVSVNANGTPRWRFDGQFRRGYRMSATIANGVLYFADDSKVFAIKP